jgi:4-amino-4-deoxy-L-arabinose transferase-like glycosyltransferase
MPRRSKRSVQQKAAEPIRFGPSISRSEWIALAAIVVLAAGLRFAYPSRMAIEHFDEGVYASNIFFSEAEGGQYPYRHLYAPPLLPFLIEWGIIFLGPESIAPFLPALILGTATVPLAWWAVRCWFGPLAGLAAGWLIATSDFHVLYSRTALTDVPVAFFILLAVYLYWEAIRRESIKWSIAAGVATGLAWWTKYTGWLPLAIALAGSVAWVVTERRAAGVSLPSRAKSVAVCFFTMAVTAFVAWSPVLWYLQPYGGYAAVAENHRGYLRPLRLWPMTLWEQAGNLATHSASMTAIGLGVLAASVPLLSHHRFATRVLIGGWCGITTSIVSMVTGPALPLVLLAAVALIVACRALPQIRTGSSGPRIDALGLWLIIAWFAGMLSTTPLYYPFPRLALPWLLASLLAVGILAKPGLLSTSDSRFHAGAIFYGAILLLPAGVLTKSFLAGVHLPVNWRSPAWQDRSALAKTSRTIAEDLPRAADNVFRHFTNSRRPSVIYVYGEPAVFFHLASYVADENMAVVPAGDLSFLDHPSTSVETLIVYSVRGGAMTPKGYPRGSADPAFRLVGLQYDTLQPSIIVRGDAETGTSLNSPPGPGEGYGLRLDALVPVRP